MAELKYERALASVRDCKQYLKNIDDDLARLESALAEYKGSIKDNISQALESSIRVTKQIIKDRSDDLNVKEKNIDDALKIHEINEST